MKAADAIALKDHIQKRIPELKTILATAVAPYSTDNVEFDDEAARLDQRISSTVDEQVVVKAQQELNRLNSNLEWLDSDEAGLCSDCGCEIPVARLQAIPTTRLCVGCAEFNS
jgi:DnaK suppressor protein